MQRYLKGWEGFAAIRRSPIAAVLLIIGKGLLPLPLLVSDLIMPALFLNHDPLYVSPPLQIWQLARFLFSIMALEKPLLVAAYLLMLTAMLFRLCLPRVEAAIFDAFNDLDTSLFKKQLQTWMGESGSMLA